MLPKISFKNVDTYWVWFWLRNRKIKWMIISNGQFFIINLLSYCLNFINCPFPFCSKSIIYLYFYYLIEYIMLLHVHWKNYELNFVRSWFVFMFWWEWKIPLVQKHHKLLSIISYCIQMVDENGETLYLSNCNMLT